MTSPSPTLNLVPSLPARRLADGRIVITQKFLDGVLELHRFWANPLTIYLRETNEETGNLDEVRVSPKDLDFRMEVLASHQIPQAIVSKGSSVVLLSLDDFQQSDLWITCRDHGVNCVYVSEYSLATRHQIIKETTSNPLKRLRRRMWESNQERRRRVAVAGATGIQCNGTPTYESYQSLNKNALLFFDSRVTESMLADECDIHARLSTFENRPMQLLFSGRLARIKGAMQLLEVAKQLRTLHVDFHLTICGDGELKEEMIKTVSAYELGSSVTFRGVLEFKTQLLPFVRSNTDLFVCCHPQGDPSCTYLETMSCGVPIAGYENEAFAGVVRSSGAGWVAPMNDAMSLALTIARVRKTPVSLRDMSVKSLQFAKEHTFGKTFLKRIDHLQRGLDTMRRL